MSRIATRIRGYVNGPPVSEHYGEWGALRPDQRRQIRELCDTCDMFEKAADEFAKRSKWISVEERLPEYDNGDELIVYTEDGRVGAARFTAINEEGFCWMENEGSDFYDGDLIEGVTHWMPLPQAPKMKAVNDMAAIIPCEKCIHGKVCAMGFQFRRETANVTIVCKDIVRKTDVAPRAEAAREICCKIEEEIVAALESNYRALKEWDDGRCNDYILEMVNRIKGKIDALRGIEAFVEELKKKYTEGEK